MKLPLFLCLALCCYPIFIKPMEEIARADQPNSENATKEKSQEEIVKEQQLAREALKAKAEIRYKDAWIGKDSRKQKYIDRASKLEVPTLKALLDNESLKTMTLRELDAIKTEVAKKIQNDQKLDGGIFGGGEKSGRFIDDLQSLLDKVTKAENSRRNSDTVNAIRDRKQVAMQEESDAQNRALQRKTATAGTIQDYLSDSNFQSIDSSPGKRSSEKLTTQNVVDQKATVLETQLAELTKKPNKTAAIEAEIQTIKDELNDHYKTIYAEANGQQESNNDITNRIDRDFSDPQINDMKNQAKSLNLLIEAERNNLSESKNSINTQLAKIADLKESITKLTLEKSKKDKEIEQFSDIYDQDTRPKTNEQITNENNHLISLEANFKILEERLNSELENLKTEQTALTSLQKQTKIISNKLTQDQSKLAQLPSEDDIYQAKNERSELNKKSNRLMAIKKHLEPKLGISKL
jgi:hypothetical protein